MSDIDTDRRTPPCGNFNKLRVPYRTAYHALFDLAQGQGGETVLIHVNATRGRSVPISRPVTTFPFQDVVAAHEAIEAGRGSGGVALVMED